MRAKEAFVGGGGFWKVLGGSGGVSWAEDCWKRIVGRGGERAFGIEEVGWGVEKGRIDDCRV